MPVYDANISIACSCLRGPPHGIIFTAVLACRSVSPHKNMNKSPRFLLPLAGSIALLLAPAHGTEIPKLQNATALNLVGAWSGGAVPGTDDTAVWDSIVTAPLSSAVGGDLSWLGLRIGSVGGARNGTTNNITIANASSANTLTLGTGGIDMSAALQTLVIQSKIALSGNQTWNIANANTNANPATLSQNEDLAFTALAAGAAINLGGFTVTKSGAGTAAISSGYTISNGTFNLDAGVLHIQGGGSRITTVNSDVTFNVNNGAQLRFGAQSGVGGITTVNNAPITLNTGSTFAVLINQANAVNLNGNITAAGNTTFSITGGSTGVTTLFGNLLGAGNITYSDTGTNAGGLLRLAGDNSGYTGILTVNGASGTRALRLTTPTAGSANATWSVAAANFLQVDGVSVNLGTLNGAGTVTNSHATNAATLNVGAGTFSGAITDGTVTTALTKNTAGTLTLSGGNFYTGATTVSNGALLVSPGVLNGTTVSVASGATYAAQSAASGALNTDVNVAGGGTMLVRPLAAGVNIDLPSLTVAGTGTVTFDTGVLGNPTTAPLSATIFNPAAGTKLKFIGSNLTAGTFPAIGYTGAIGGGGFAGLSLALPFRITGGLVDNAGVSVDVNITGTAKPAWRGNIDGNWNIDSVGDGSTGTPNWLAGSGPNTYVEAAVGTDSVVFDDTAAGGITNVNLTTTLSPGGVSVGNSTLAYTFSGSGRISGAGALIKTGTGALVVANTGTNDFAGGAFIDEGTVTVGDGATANAGTLGVGTVTMTSPGTLEFNRTEAFTFANVITGEGGLKNSQAGTVTLAGATTAGAVNLAAGTLRFTGGGNLNGAVTGSGALTVAGGTLQFSGNDANTFSGPLTVSGGALQLNKTAGVNAVAGDITISGTGSLQLLSSEQIPDTATINFIGSSTSSVPTQAFGGETVANVIVNSSVGGAAGGQFIMGTSNSSFTITNTATVTSGILGVASGGTGTVNAIVITSPTAIVRIAGSGGPSILNVGAGGITTVGGDIQVKFNANNQDATLNLGGNFIATGNVTFSNAGYTGGNLNVINLTGTRTFDIASGTTTTIAPDVAGPGGIIKTGNGTLQLTAASDGTYTGATTVSEGTFLTTPAQIGGGSVSVAGGATLGVNLTFGGTTLNVTDATTAAASTLQFATGALGNPSAPVLFAGAFTVDGATTIRLTGSGLASGTGIPLIAYGTLGGVAGFGGLSISLPTRMGGTLVNNLLDSRVDLDLSVEQAKWNGSVNGNWDIDPDGTGGSGTANWRTTVLETPTRYFQGPPISTDTANFDDSATGTTTVNLTTALTPVATNVNNTAKTYTFAGPGTLTGATTLNKSGPGALILANANAYNHTGGTNVNEGSLHVGDGVTPGVGFLPTTAVTNNAAIVLNRPDDFAVSTTINGFGTIIKLGANTATFAIATIYAGPVEIDGGALMFSAGGNLSGAVTGVGALAVAGGTLQLSGNEANTFSGLTTVNNGTLQLNKEPGVDAIGGNLLFTGTGGLTLSQADQIPDTATVTYNKTGTNQGTIILGSNGVAAPNTVILHEIIATLNVLDGNDTGTQVQGHSGLEVTGNLNLAAGAVFAVASGHAVKVGGVTLTGTPVLRIAANSNFTTLDVGAAGITASGGTIQVGQGVGAFDAVLNLGGDVTTTGDLAFTDGNFTGGNLRQITLTGARIFNIGASTTTTVAPDIAGPGGLSKTGDGTLSLDGDQNYDTLTTNAGTTNVNGAFTSGTATVNADATTNFGVSQTLFALNIGTGAVVAMNQTPAFADFGAAAGASAVPEPGALSLLLLGALGCLSRRRR